MGGVPPQPPDADRDDTADATAARAEPRRSVLTAQRIAARRLDRLFGELHAAEELDTALLNAGLSYLLVLAWRAFLDSGDIIEGGDVHPAEQSVARVLRAGDLTTLARASGLSPSHLSRLFKAQTGLTISRFRNQQRIQRFMLLYRDGRDTTALAAALEAGFGSYAQFYRVFSAETCHRPTLSRTRSLDR